VKMEMQWQLYRLGLLGQEAESYSAFAIVDQSAFRDTGLFYLRTSKAALIQPRLLRRAASLSAGKLIDKQN